MAVTYADVQQLARALPGVEEGPWYGKPAMKVLDKGFLRLFEDEESVVLRIEIARREILLRNDPATYYITDHYANYPAMLARLSRLKKSEARELVEGAWRRVAPKRLVAEFDARRSS